MSIPSPPPPPLSSSINTISQSPKMTTIDGLHFHEDPRFCTWHKSLLTGNGPETVPIGAFEKEIEIQDHERPYDTTSKQLQPSSDNTKPTLFAGNFKEEPSHVLLEGRGLSPDSGLDDHKRLSCTSLHLPSTGIGRSATLLKARLSQKWRLSKSIRVQLHSSKPKELAQIHKPGRIRIPRQITIGRKLQWQEKAENRRVNSVTDEAATQNHIKLRLVNSEVEKPRSSGTARDPELLAMLHDPSQKRFSDSWEKFYAEQTQETVGGDEILLAISNTAESIAKVKDQAHGPTVLQGSISYLPDVQIGPVSAATKMTKSGDEPQKVVHPNQGSGNSSRGGILTRLIGSGKVPPPVMSPRPSPLLNHARPSNISKPRKASESSFMADCNNNMHPAHSTDTLARIEVEIQRRPSRPALVDINNVPVRLPKNLSTVSGPSGSPPVRSLPQLPVDSASENSESRESSCRHHSTEQSQSSLGHAMDTSSVSSVSAVRGASYSKSGRPVSSTQDHAWNVVPNARYGVTHGQTSDANSFGHLAVSRSDALGPLTQLHGREYTFPAPAEAFSRKQAQRAARAESRRILKQRDLASSHATIKEENENESLSQLKQVVDTIDQFPEPPLSRSTSRASRTNPRRTRSTQRSQSVVRRVPSRGFANQILTASRIITIEDADPTTPNLKSKRTSTGTATQYNPVREGAIDLLRHEKTHGLHKPRSIRSHTSTSAVSVEGAHAARSSDLDASDEELTCGEIYRRALSREIQKIRACMIMQDRAIDKLQNMMLRYMTIRNRSRELSLEGQLAQGPPSSRLHPQRVISSTTAMNDTAPGPAMTTDAMVVSAHRGLGHDAGKGFKGANRLSGAPEAAKMDSMVDQTFGRLF